MITYSSVAQSLFLLTVKRLHEFSAPRYVSSSKMCTAVIQLVLKSDASSSIVPSSGLYTRREMDFIRSPTTMKSPRDST